jgi:hypothetical protein
MEVLVAARLAREKSRRDEGLGSQGDARQFTPGMVRCQRKNGSCTALSFRVLLTWLFADKLNRQVAELRLHFALVQVEDCVERMSRAR